MPLTNLTEQPGCRYILWLVGGGTGLMLLLSVLPTATVGPNGPLQKAKTHIRNLEIAVKGYQTEYNHLPFPQSLPPVADNSGGHETTSAEGKQLIEILTATDTEKNPRRIPFYEPPPALSSGRGYTKAGGLKDAWGSKGYVIHFDYGGDGKISDPEHPGATIEAPVIIYSAGPDGDYGTWKDNVKSWER